MRPAITSSKRRGRKTIEISHRLRFRINFYSPRKMATSSTFWPELKQTHHGSHETPRSNDDDDERSAIYPCKRRAQARNVRPSEHLELGNRERKTWRGSPSPPPSSSLHSPRTCEHARFAPLSQIVPYPPPPLARLFSLFKAATARREAEIEAQAAADSVLGPTTARFVELDLTACWRSEGKIPPPPSLRRPRSSRPPSVPSELAIEILG